MELFAVMRGAAHTGNWKGVIMKDEVKALLIHDQSETLATLRGVLERLGLSVIQAESYAQAKRWLGGLNPIPLVFTDTQLPDGNWADVVAVAGKAARPVNVIVVARVVNTRFYVEVIEYGAFDFIAPPFNATDLAYVVRTAVDNVVGRRSASSKSSPVPAEDLVAEVGQSGCPPATV